MLWVKGHEGRAKVPLGDKAVRQHQATKVEDPAVFDVANFELANIDELLRVPPDKATS